jgi:hypothetical protein
MSRSIQVVFVGGSRFGAPVQGVSRGGRPSPRAPWWVLLGGLVLLAAGCSRDGGQAAPDVSPRAAADQALAEYDANKDGVLDAKEMEACPGLLGALKRIDKDNDNRLTADEIADRLTFFQQQGMLGDASVSATLDGRPLAGATITLVPEKFMGSSIKSASAITDELGSGFFKMEGTEYIQVAFGYYRVQVSKKVQGRETIPAKYNAQTVLGQEVSPDVDGRGSSLTIRLRLTSR